MKHPVKNLPVGPLTRSVIVTLNVPDEWDYKKEMEELPDERYGEKL